MRTKLIMLSLAAALITVGGVTFEAKATMGVSSTQSLSAPAKSYSLIEKASCNGRGLFCQAGTSLQCNPICTCVPCSTPAPVRVKRHKHAS
jgi:hypothetical protein